MFQIFKKKTFACFRTRDGIKIGGFVAFLKLQKSIALNSSNVGQLWLTTSFRRIWSDNRLNILPLVVFMFGQENVNSFWSLEFVLGTQLKIDFREHEFTFVPGTCLHKSITEQSGIRFSYKNERCDYLHQIWNTFFELTPHCTLVWGFQRTFHEDYASIAARIY